MTGARREEARWPPRTPLSDRTATRAGPSGRVGGRRRVVGAPAARLRDRRGGNRGTLRHGTGRRAAVEPVDPTAVGRRTAAPGVLERLAIRSAVRDRIGPVRPVAVRLAAAERATRIVTRAPTGDDPTAGGPRAARRPRPEVRVDRSVVSRVRVMPPGALPQVGVRARVLMPHAVGTAGRPVARRRRARRGPDLAAPALRLGRAARIGRAPAVPGPAAASVPPAADGNRVAVTVPRVRTVRAAVARRRAVTARGIKVGARQRVGRRHRQDGMAHVVEHLAARATPTGGPAVRLVRLRVGRALVAPTPHAPSRSEGRAVPRSRVARPSCRTTCCRATSTARLARACGR